MTYYVLFFLHLESRRVTVAGITRHPDQEWMEQIARSATQDTWGYLHPCRYVLHDRDAKFCASFRLALATGGIKAIPLPARSPNLKRVRRTLGPLRQTGMSIQIRSFRTGLTVACADRVQLALSPRTKSPRERQLAAVFADSR